MLCITKQLITSLSALKKYSRGEISLYTWLDSSHSTISQVAITAGHRREASGGAEESSPRLWHSGDRDTDERKEKSKAWDSTITAAPCLRVNTRPWSFSAASQAILPGSNRCVYFSFPVNTRRQTNRELWAFQLSGATSSASWFNTDSY